MRAWGDMPSVVKDAAGAFGAVAIPVAALRRFGVGDMLARSTSEGHWYSSGLNTASGGVAPFISRNPEKVAAQQASAIASRNQENIRQRPPSSQPPTGTLCAHRGAREPAACGAGGVGYSDHRGVAGSAAAPRGCAHHSDRGRRGGGVMGIGAQEHVPEWCAAVGCGRDRHRRRGRGRGRRRRRRRGGGGPWACRRQRDRDGRHYRGHRSASGVQHQTSGECRGGGTVGTVPSHDAVHVRRCRRGGPLVPRQQRHPDRGRRVLRLQGGAGLPHVQRTQRTRRNTARPTTTPAPRRRRSAV